MTTQDPPSPKDPPPLWPWALLALVLLASIVLFFVYVPRGANAAALLIR